MSLIKGAKAKTHICQRYRSERTLRERWSREKSAFVGYLTGSGHLSNEIARILADGTISPTVRAMWKRWRLYDFGLLRRAILMPVSLGSEERKTITSSAAKEDLAPEEWMRRIVVCALDDDMYEAIVG